jgi:hypothetical protein
MPNIFSSEAQLLGKLISSRVEELYGYSPVFMKMNHASDFWKASLARRRTIVEKIRN